MAKNLPLDPKLVLDTGRYSFNFDLPSLVLDRLNAQPRIAQLAGQLLAGTQGAVRLIGAGVSWFPNPDGGAKRLFSVTFEVDEIGTFPNGDDVLATAAVLPIITALRLVAIIGVALAISLTFDNLFSIVEFVPADAVEGGARAAQLFGLAAVVTAATVLIGRNG